MLADFTSTMLILYDDWVDVDEVPPMLCIRELVSNVRKICEPDGKLLSTFVESHWAKVLSIHSMPGFGISSHMTGWVGDVTENRFYRFTGAFHGINGDDGKERFQLSIEDGYYDTLNEAIVEGDQFCDVKLDSESIQAAIKDVKSLTIVLINSPSYERKSCMLEVD